MSRPYVGTAGQAAGSYFYTLFYDALGRLGIVQDPLDNAVTMDFGPGNEAFAEISWGGERAYQYDGLGRLTSVCELTSSLPGNGTCDQTANETGYWTTYSYDVLNDLTKVVQNAQSSSPQS